MLPFQKALLERNDGPEAVTALGWHLSPSGTDWNHGPKEILECAQR